MNSNCCVIIAAGAGSRLQDMGINKPLIPILGIPIIEHVILALILARITKVYVVVGFNQRVMCRSLKTLEKKLNITIIPIVNEEWRKGNGLSVLKARCIPEKIFLLLMADHIFDFRILNDLNRYSLKSEEMVLVIDNDLENKFVDIEDVTKVKSRDNKLYDIGKGLSKFNGFDTGIFLCTRILFSKLIETTFENKYSLTDAVRLLALNCQVNTINTDKFWIDIDNANMLNIAQENILHVLPKLQCDQY